MSYETGPKPYVYQEIPQAQFPPSAQPVRYHNTPPPQATYVAPPPTTGHPVAPSKGSAVPTGPKPYQYTGPAVPIQNQKLKPTPPGGWPAEPPYTTGEPVYLGATNGHEPIVTKCPRCNYEGETVIR